MNLNKARDFYSAYYEETLDEGLRQAFERAMALDARVGAEYRQFVRIMEQLSEPGTPIDVPSDLHLKIRNRVDAHIQAAEAKSKSSSWFFGWKPIAYGAVATIAIISGVVSVSNFGGNAQKVSTAGIASVSDAAPRIELKEGVLSLQVAAAKSNTVAITDIATGRQIFSQNLISQRLDCPITNSEESARAVQIQFSRDFPRMIVVVPGTKLATSDEGKGTVVDMAIALANMYDTPVVLRIDNPTVLVQWSFEGTDAHSAATDELSSLGLKCEVRTGGLFWVSSS